jgi:hypothetical protein
MCRSAGSRWFEADREEEHMPQMDADGGGPYVLSQFDHIDLEPLD